MRLKLNMEELRQYLSQSTFHVDGDYYEQQFGNSVTSLFSRCEEFWQIFVVPLTRRIEIPDGYMKDKILFRDSLDPKLMNIAITHYSMYMHLAYAHWHYQNRIPSFLENIYTHLISACDLAEATIEGWYSLMLECQGKKPGALSTPTREEVISKAGILYDKYYGASYIYHNAKGHEKPLYLLIGEKHRNLLSEYYGNDKALKRYIKFTNMLRHFRNIVVHEVKLAVIIDEKKHIMYIPKLKKIDGYRTWQSVYAAKSNQEIIDRDFVEIGQLIQESIQQLEICLNTLWAKLIKDVVDEFYSTERNALRSLYEIEFSKVPNMTYIDKSKDKVAQDSFDTPPSGTYPRLDEWKNISSATSTSGSGFAKISDDKTPQ